MTQDKKKATGRHMNLTPEFRSEAVRLVMNSGRSARKMREKQSSDTTPTFHKGLKGRAIDV